MSNYTVEPFTVEFLHTLDINDTIITNETTERSQDPSRYYGKQVQIYVSPILLVFGTLGNMMAFVVLFCRCLKATPMHNFLLVLSVADTLVLWLGIFKAWMRRMTGYELNYHSEGMCQTIQFLKLSTWYLSSWIIVIMTVERFVAIWFPFWLQNLWSIKQARIVSVGLVFLACAANVHVFWTYGHVYDSRKKVYCTFDQDNEFMDDGFEALKLSLYCFIPFIVVFILNLLIIVQIRQNQSVFKEDTERISIILLTISFSWIILTLPYSLTGLVDGMSFLTRIIFFQMMYLNHSINFVLYCLTGGRFRDELCNMLKKPCGKKKPERNHHFMKVATSDTATSSCV